MRGRRTTFETPNCEDKDSREGLSTQEMLSPLELEVVASW